MAATLPRELIKWIQSLDLASPVRNAKWDISNGYLVAEIFSWYYPQDVEMCYFQNGSALPSKLSNWSLLKKFIKQKALPIPEHYCDAVMHSKEGAAVLMLQILYQLLTNRQLKVIPADPEIDFTDHAYQLQLPDHARSTAVQAIRNNLKGTELMICPNLTTKRQLSQAVINRHAEDRMKARQADPVRYGHRPTIGERCIRRPPPVLTSSSDDQMNSVNCEEDLTNIDLQQQQSDLHEVYGCSGGHSSVHFDNADQQVVD